MKPLRRQIADGLAKKDVQPRGVICVHRSEGFLHTLVGSGGEEFLLLIGRHFTFSPAA